MTPFDYLIIIGGICGLFMVVGSMLLLYKGIITLSNTSQNEALSVDFNKMIKITTHYPALGLFVVGLFFLVISLQFSKPKEVIPLAIKGHVTVADPSSVTIFVYAGQGGLRPLTDGAINDIINVHPDLRVLRVDVTAPGYDPPIKTTIIENSAIKKGLASLGEITFENRKGGQPEINPDNIKPTHDILPPLAAGGRF